MKRYFSLKLFSIGLALGLWSWVFGQSSLPTWLLSTPLLPHPGWFPIGGMAIVLAFAGLARRKDRIGYLAAGDFWNFKAWLSGTFRGVISVLAGIGGVAFAAFIESGGSNAALVAAYSALLVGTFAWYQFCLSQVALASWLRHRVRLPASEA